jgi:hypothetical protein
MVKDYPKGKKKNAQLLDFQILTKEEVKTIRNSETAEAILPF